MVRLPLLLLSALLCTGCVFNTRCTDLNGLTDNDGQEIVYQQTSIVAIHAIFGLWPLIEDASLTNSVNEFTAQAADAGDTRMRIAQSSGSNYWWVLPPLSFLFTPVTADIAGAVR